MDRKNLIAAVAAGRSRGIIPAASFGGKKHFFFLAVVEDSSKSRSTISSSDPKVFKRKTVLLAKLGLQWHQLTVVKTMLL